MTKHVKRDAMATESNPLIDLTEMLKQFKVPGVDMSSIVEAQRKDIQALVEANKLAYEGMQALGRKQTEMLAQAMQGIQDVAKAAASGVGMADPAKQAELARNACQKALADMKDLAEIVRQSQADAMASIANRANEHMQEIRKLMQSN